MTTTIVIPRSSPRRSKTPRTVRTESLSGPPVGQPRQAGVVEDAVVAEPDAAGGRGVEGGQQMQQMQQRRLAAPRPAASVITASATVSAMPVERPFFAHGFASTSLPATQACAGVPGAR
ncbi:MAG: hypothetical protein ACYCU7_18140 [Acidimicrobiales bacterium]